MNLLLDEHYSPRIAVQLRERGYDVVAVSERADLRHLPDEELLRRAQQERRVLVTEDAGDYMVLHGLFLRRGEVHAGILFTSSRAFPRDVAAIGRLIAALATFLEERGDADVLEGETWWL